MNEDPRIRDRRLEARRESYETDRMPTWTQRAACRDKTTVAGLPWESAFADDLTYKPNGEYRWPASVMRVMKVCAVCPVQDECLDYGFAMEEPILLGSRPIVTLDGGHSWVDEFLVPIPTGIYGGVPGPQRQRYSGPDRIERARAWFSALSHRRGWTQPKRPDEEVA